LERRRANGASDGQWLRTGSQLGPACWGRVWRCRTARRSGRRARGRGRGIWLRAGRKGRRWQGRRSMKGREEAATGEAEGSMAARGNGRERWAIGAPVLEGSDRGSWSLVYPPIPAPGLAGTPKPSRAIVGVAAEPCWARRGSESRGAVEWSIPHGLRYDLLRLCGPLIWRRLCRVDGKTWQLAYVQGTACDETFPMQVYIQAML